MQQIKKIISKNKLWPHTKIGTESTTKKTAEAGKQTAVRQMEPVQRRHLGGEVVRARKVGPAEGSDERLNIGELHHLGSKNIHVAVTVGGVDVIVNISVDDVLHGAAQAPSATGSWAHDGLW